MRILFLIEALSSGGAERQLVNLMNGLVSNGHQVYCVTWVLNHHYNESDISGVIWHQINRNHKFDINLFMFIRNLIKKNNIHIIQGFLDTGNLYSLISSIGLKNVKVFASERSAERKLKFFAKVHKPIVHKLVVKTIANSEAGKTYLHKLCGSNLKVDVVRNTFDSDLYCIPSNYEKRQLRTELNIKEDVKVFINVARIVPLKQQFEIVVTFIKVFKNDDSILLLIGLPNIVYLNKIEQFVKENNFSNRIHILKPVKNIQKYYKIADVFVLYSKYEGSPNVLVEAMLSGLFIISSKCGDSEFYLNLSEGNELISLDDKDGLEKAFKKILMYHPSMIQNVGIMNRNLLIRKTNFKLNDFVKSYERIYLE